MFRCYGQTCLLQIQPRLARLTVFITFISLTLRSYQGCCHPCWGTTSLKRDATTLIWKFRLEVGIGILDSKCVTAFLWSVISQTYSLAYIKPNTWHFGLLWSSFSVCLFTLRAKSSPPICNIVNLLLKEGIIHKLSNFKNDSWTQPFFWTSFPRLQASIRSHHEVLYFVLWTPHCAVPGFNLHAYVLIQDQCCRFTYQYKIRAIVAGWVMKVRYSQHIKSDVEEFTGHSSDNIDMWAINA